MIVSKDANDLIIRALDEARNNKHEYVTAEHLLYSALEDEEIQGILENLECDIDSLKKNLKNYMDNFLEKVEKQINLEESYSFQQVLLMASEHVINCGKEVIEVEHIIAAIYNLEESYALYFLEESGVNKTDLLYYLSHGREELEDTEKNDLLDDEEELDYEENSELVSKEKLLNKYTVNLNESVKKDGIDPLIGREDIIERTLQILCRRTKNNPVHVGEPGVGKTAIVMGLAERLLSGEVPEKLKGSEIYSLDIGSVLAGTKYRGDFEERIKKVLDELKKKDNPIVYIDEIHNIVGAGSLGAGSLDASNLLKPYLMEGKIRFIGATTFEEYKKYFENDKALIRRFQTIEVKEPSIDETIDIINGLKVNYENYHNVKYTEDAIKTAVNLSAKYINDRYLPDKAIDIIDEAGSYISMNKKEELEDSVIDEKIIEEIISKICHIPKKTVEKNEINSLKNLEGILKENVFGQDKAIKEVVRCIKMSRAGLNAEGKPVASMLFVGPTGVGKTEIARKLSESLGIDLIRFDMSEYAEKHAASKLIGSPPGYVGYEEGGLLTDAIRKKPHAVLLLDEVEKAHGDILNVLLQVMDYATLTDNKGRKADFRNVILIMTSNAGASNIGKKLVGFGEREIVGEAINEEVKKVFTPEFRNRLDKIVVFNHVNDEMALNIVRKELKNFKVMLKDKNVDISFTEEVVKYVAKKGVSREFGAREIIRLINSKIKPILIDEILFGALSKGGKGTIDIKDEEFTLEIG
ncbi:ATP-dependent Clp protease ATP-binding subunit ClpA [Clostridium cavendishii DSM 21758]|uniref:ATP-dependent Clp protease ATP-binding subunit ClpA n=1 Tax=Clostridium cavendishii DSM 21758 TaxID=1121302 RepID=A0A1M6A868_9CLOT|nr:ATP-dependent Clp protease ATP-binding subunit ClpA [Clostridium cavendishii]SHI32333.1 ATP-dependent Clp protease ATP-binding subunit ClpA [Clostridium cavendishii DSM 21758]